MTIAKMSVSVDEELVRFVERYQTAHEVRTKSEVVERALQLLRDEELIQQYMEAFKEWRESDDVALWDATLADGLERDETW